MEEPNLEIEIPEWIKTIRNMIKNEKMINNRELLK